MSMIFNGIAIAPTRISATASGGWYDGSWTYRKQITVSAADVSPNHADRFYGLLDVPTSPDVFDLDAGGYFVWGPNVYEVGGTYYLIYSRWTKASGFDTGWYAGAEIAYATASDPEGPFTHQGVLLQGAGGAAWDSDAVFNAKVVQDGDNWRLYYTGTQGTQATQQIGVATASSIDGTYTRSGNNPIIAQGGGGAWDEYMASNPTVVIDSGTYYLWYKGAATSGGVRKIGLATASSYDGAFTKEATNPVIDEGANIEDPHAWKEGGRFNMLMDDQAGTHVTASNHIWYWSNDGITWTAPTDGRAAYNKGWFGGDSDNAERSFISLDSNGRKQYMYVARKTSSASYIAYGTFPDIDLTAFPALLDITDADLAAEARSDAFDIVFTSSDGTTEIPYERQEWDSGTGALTAWVKLDLSGDTDTTFYMYYGNASQASDKQQAASVWDSNHQMVWHMEEDPSGGAPQMQDSTSNGNDGTTGGTMTSGDLVTGKIGEGLDLDGSDDYIGFSPVTMDPDSFTAEIWVNLNSKTANELFFIVYATTTANKQGRWTIHYDADTDLFEAQIWEVGGGAWNQIIASDITPSTATWYLLALAYNGQVCKLLVNGVVEQAEIINHGDFTDIGTRVGSWPTGIRFIPAKLDEVRLSNTARSANWLDTAHHNQDDPAGFVTVGSEETP